MSGGKHVKKHGQRHKPCNPRLITVMNARQSGAKKHVAQNETGGGEGEREGGRIASSVSCGGNNGQPEARPREN